MDGIYRNIEYNPNKKRKKLIVFDDMIADVLSNKKLYPIVTESFIRGRKLSNSLDFITQSYFAFPKNIRLNSMHYFIKKFQKSDNPLRFRKNLFEKIYKLIMKIDDKIRDEKLQYSIYR